MRVFFIFYLFLSYSAFSQINTSNQQWIQYYPQIALTKNFSVISDAGFRLQNTFKNNSAFIVRSGFAYEINSSFRISTAFACVGQYGGDTIRRFEFRPHQEVSYKKSINQLKIENRLRIEQRIFNNYSLGELIQPGTMNWRFRYQCSFNFPIWNFNKSDSSKLVSFTVYDELFVNAGKNVTSLFDQNRFAFGPTLHLNKNLNFSLFYNGQFASTPADDVYSFTSIYWLMIRQKIILRKKK